MVLKSRKKTTALDKFLAEQRGIIPWYQRLLLPIVFGLSLVGALIFGHQLYAQLQDHFHAEYLAETADELSQVLQAELATYGDRLRGQASQRTVIEVMQSNNEQRRLQAEQRLAQPYPRALRYRLVEPDGLRFRQAESFPGLSFGVLDMLMLSQETGQQPLTELHLYGGEDQHINIARRIEDNGELIGFALLSLPIDLVTRPVADFETGSAGQVVLTQDVPGRSRLQVAATRGTASGEEPAELVEVPGTIMRLDAIPTVGFSFLGERTYYVLILGLLGSLLLGPAIYLLRNRLESEAVAKASDQSQPTPEEAEDDVESIIPAPSALSSGDIEVTELDQQPAAEPADSTAQEKYKVDPSLFRAYDIRGVVDKSLTESTALLIGQAIGSEAHARGESQIIVARDGRNSGPRLSAALMDGLQGSGMDVIDIGQAPTPVLYFATHHLSIPSGVMVTGSHNPPDYNGFKIVLAGETLAAEQIKDLHRRIEEDDLLKGSGGGQSMDVMDDYVERIASDVQLSETIKVVVDAGNGVTGEVAPDLLEAIGCEVITLHCDIDGDFPNHHPDPSVPENLSDVITMVENQGADIGIAFDGDGDRLGVVTNDGQIIYSDRLLMLFARDVLSRDPGAMIIYDVKCTGHLASAIVEAGGRPQMWKTGHSFIKRKMKETGAALGGEMSGHFFFAERWYGFDDGLYAAARLLEIIASSGLSLSELMEEIPDAVNTPELKVEMEEGEHYRFVEAFAKQASFEGARLTTIDGIRADFSDGWGLVRCSNTTPCLVLRFEANNETALKRIQNQFREQLLALRGDLELPF